MLCVMRYELYLCKLRSGLPALCIGVYCIVAVLVHHFVDGTGTAIIYGDVTGTRDM